MVLVTFAKTKVTPAESENLCPNQSYANLSVFKKVRETHPTIKKLHLRFLHNRRFKFHRPKTIDFTINVMVIRCVMQ